MILYFAGNVIDVVNEQSVWDGGVRNRLLSFADIDDWAKRAIPCWVDDPPMFKGRFFLDSGAFGAFTRGAQIDLQRYCDYVKQYDKTIEVYAALDVIGNWRASSRNYDVMREKGLRPIPTFHMDSPLVELRRLLSLTDYIALGGVVGASKDTMQPWLDKCFFVIGKFWPKKVHLFGVTAQWALERYPCYSADSTSALVGGGMGRILSFKQSKISSMDWHEYARLTYDGSVMDRISTDMVGNKAQSAHKGRRNVNIRVMKQLERHLTDVWRYRGITWEDENAPV